MRTQSAVERLNRSDLESAVLVDSRSSSATPLQQDITGRTPITTYVRLAGIAILALGIYTLIVGYQTHDTSLLGWGVIGTPVGGHLAFFPRGYGLFRR